MPGPLHTIRLGGELDLQSARELAPALSEAVGDTSRNVLIDLRDVTFLDSTMLGALARAASRMSNQGRRLTLVRTPGGAVDRLLELSGTASGFDVVSEPPEPAAA